MRLLRLSWLLIALSCSPALAQEEGTGLSFKLSKGAVHLVVMNGLIGAGAGSIIFIDALSRRAPGSAAVGGAEAVGMIALFLGGGLTVGHLVDPTPPMAWSSLFAGGAGAGVSLGILMMTATFGALPRSELTLFALALGYFVGSGIDLALPGRDTLSWKEFWVPMAVAFIPGGALLAIGLTQGLFQFGFTFNSRGSVPYVVLSMLYPVVAFLATRGILGALKPFDPWIDDLKPPFRAEPIISFSSTGFSVGLAATW